MNSLSRLGWLVLGAALLACLGWAYWPGLTEMAHRWSTQAQYSHGYLVPLFALYLLWHRRAAYQQGPFAPSWWGVFWLAVGSGMRLFSGYYFLTSLDDLSLLPTLAGLVLLLGGGKALAWSWPSIAFLVFMLPLPHTLNRALTLPLQRIGTVASTYVLQTLGFPALSEGNVILLNEHRIGVVEACSGLGMMMTFCALAVGFVMVIRPRPLDTLILLLSAIPIAILANVFRITVTAILYDRVSIEAGAFFHDKLAPYPMMGLALVLLWLEIWLLSKLLIDPHEDRPMTVGLPGQPGLRPHPVPPGGAPSSLKVRP